MREIVLDTETTGMDPADGHRLVEIGCVEIENYLPTGRTYHQYINPEREVDPEAVAVHGLTDEFLKDKPVFASIYTDFIDFLGDARLVIHNAAFDMKFINAELRKVGHKGYKNNRVIDTLLMAREKFPGSPANLDALCRRFDIDNSNRELHGALLDAQLLADVYLELAGGRQHGLILAAEKERQNLSSSSNAIDAAQRIKRPYRDPRSHQPKEEELAAHAEMLAQLKDPIWPSTKESESVSGA